MQFMDALMGILASVMVLTLYIGYIAWLVTKIVLRTIRKDREKYGPM
ncbi:hypothetical protein [Butyricicoccus sp. Marseille-Q5471]|nr:hypothetical protein [Butyricicoccus sp. Marseille-Q5471]